MYSQVLFGARKSLTVAISAGVIAMTIAVLVGVSSGYFGGKIDERLNFITNVFLVFPQLPLLIVLAAFLGQVGFVGYHYVVRNNLLALGGEGNSCTDHGN